jgi:anti-anti-sigma regulatory factor
MSAGYRLTHLGGAQVLLEPSEALDASHPEIQMGEIYAYLRERRARRLIFDAQPIPLIDTTLYAWLDHLARLCHLADTELVVVGMRPEAAFALARNTTEPPPFACEGNVERARSRPLPH